MLLGNSPASFAGADAPASSTENPCTGAKGTLTEIAANAIFHITTQADGNRWMTGNAEGTATFTPEESGGVFFSGHFKSWFGEELNNKNSVMHETGSFVLNGTDGSRVVVHTRGHLSIDAKGAVKVQVETLTAHCG